MLEGGRSREGGTAGQACSCLWHGVQPLLPLLAGSSVGRTLPLAQGFVPPRCCALCFRGWAPGAAESQLSLPAASVLQRQPESTWGRAAPEQVLWCGPIPGTGVSPKSPASGQRRGAHTALPGGSVLLSIPPLPCHAQQRCVIILQVCTPLFPLPAVLVACGIHQASLGSCGPSGGAGRCSLPCSSSTA